MRFGQVVVCTRSVAVVCAVSACAVMYAMYVRSSCFEKAGVCANLRGCVRIPARVRELPLNHFDFFQGPLEA